MKKPVWLQVRRFDDAERRGYLAAAALLWATFALVLLFDIASYRLIGIRYDPSGSSELLIVGALFALLAVIYTGPRFDALLSSIFNSLIFLILSSSVLTAYTYATTALGADVPLCDPWLNSIDDMVGLSWRSYLQTVNGLAENTPFLAMAAESIYGSIGIQLIATIIVLSIVGQYERLQAFWFAYVISLLIVGAMEGAFPAVGTYEFYHIDPSMHPNLNLTTKSSHLEHYLPLRDGTFTTFSLEQAKGIITFPSFHTTIAILFTWAMWRVPGLSWAALVINGIMIAATPLYGSHYFADVIAGAAVAPAAIAAAEAIRWRSGAWWHLLFSLSDRTQVLSPSRT